MQLKIGILQTDAVLEEFQPEFGDYPQMFEHLLRQAATRFPGLELELPVYAVYRGQLPAAEDGCDGYVITGSRHSVYDDLPWIPPLVDFLRNAIATGAKVVGICFGHQLLAHFFGGATGPAEVGWNVGVHSSRILAAQPWMRPPRERLRLLSSHKDQVSELPDGASLFASSEHCPLAGFVIGDRVLTLQGHPEFNSRYARALMQKRAELLGREKFQAGIESLEQETDEAVTGIWILNFLGAH